MNDAKFGPFPRPLSPKYNFSALDTSLDTPSRGTSDFTASAIQRPMHTPQALSHQQLPVSNGPVFSNFQAYCGTIEPRP
jgi:hypothetical protein